MANYIKGTQQRHSQCTMFHHVRQGVLSIYEWSFFTHNVMSLLWKGQHTCRLLSEIPLVWHCWFCKCPYYHPYSHTCVSQKVISQKVRTDEHSDCTTSLFWFVWGYRTSKHEQRPLLSRWHPLCQKYLQVQNKGPFPFDISLSLAAAIPVTELCLVLLSDID